MLTLLTNDNTMTSQNLLLTNQRTVTIRIFLHVQEKKSTVKYRAFIPSFENRAIRYVNFIILINIEHEFWRKIDLDQYTLIVWQSISQRRSKVYEFLRRSDRKPPASGYKIKRLYVQLYLRKIPGLGSQITCEANYFICLPKKST